MKQEKIKVKIITKQKDVFWYKIGETYEVLNHISFNWHDGKPHFEQGLGSNGIYVSDCEILTPKSDIPEYTMDEAIGRMGHEFKIKK